MKKDSTKQYIRNLSIIIVLMFSVTQLYSNKDNQVYVSGQVTNQAYGSPVSNHPVYIESEGLIPSAKGYSKVVYTDEFGYYYDTISTPDKKGSILIYTIDHYGKTIDTTLHFRFLSRAMSLMIADFNIYLPLQVEKLQARFKYLQKVNGPRKEFHFIDETQNENIVNWKWDFGDGTVSFERNPVHTYNDYGLYRVSLTVEALINGEMIKSLIIKQLYIKQYEFYHMGGHVFSEHFPIDLGYAYLYLIDSANNYHPIDTMPFDTLGYYYFYQLPAANYIIKAEPMKESQHYGTLLPTYYGNVLHWQDANIIDLKNTSWEYDIALDKSMGVMGGTGIISGRIEYVTGGKSHSGLFAEGINIYLIDQSDNMLTCHYSNETGAFDFANIEVSSYLLYPEVTGIESEPLPIKLTDANPVAENIEISILSSGISYVVPSASQEEKLISAPYPNPALNSINFEIWNQNGSDITLEIFDSYGRLVYQSTTDNLSGIHNLDLSRFARAYYTLRATSVKQSSSNQFIIAR